ncbi:response regulator [candidate division KSB1 bacterium]|nr:response regulator [candidate division KSB1 bacterium]
MDSNGKIHILVADDDPDILGYFRAIIRDPRYQLYLVPNGARAIEEAENHKIDLAFLDINMPEFGGIETLVKWKTIQSATRIVMISSYSDGNLVREAIEKGAYTYLFKPLNKMDIFSVTVKSLKSTGINDVFSFK